MANETYTVLGTTASGLAVLIPLHGPRRTIARRLPGTVRPGQIITETDIERHAAQSAAWHGLLASWPIWSA